MYSKIKALLAAVWSWITTDPYAADRAREREEIGNDLAP